jgi:hypothetical protein
LCCYTLGAALAVNTGLVELMLSSNSISGKGFVALAKGIKENESLASVEIDHNNIGGGEGGAAIREAVDGGGGGLYKSNPFMPHSL